MSDVTTEPCVCVQDGLENYGPDTVENTKPQEGGLCLHSHTDNTAVEPLCCCCVVSQSNVSCCKRSDNLTLDLTLDFDRVDRGVSA